MEQQKNTKDLIKSVVDNLPGLVFRVINDGQWTFEFASQGAMELLEYAPEKLVSAKSLRPMIPQKDQKKNKQILSKISMGMPHYEVVYRIRTASGKIKWVKEEGTAVFKDKNLLYSASSMPKCFLCVNTLLNTVYCVM